MIDVYSFFIQTWIEFMKNILNKKGVAQKQSKKTCEKIKDALD